LETAISINNNQTKPGFMPYLVCGLAAMFYLYEYILQVSPSVMTDVLMRDLQIDAAGLGGMAAFYFYAYAPMQIPAGLLFDKYGPRVLITIALLGCSAGAFFFAWTPNLALASLGRAFMGAGSAFSFIGILVLISRWFPPSYFAILAGVAQLMSSIGAITGEAPLARAVESHGWRSTTFFLGVLGVILAGFVWKIVRDYPPGATAEEQHPPEESYWEKLRIVLAKPQTWFVGGFNFLIWAPIAVFAALWGVPYLSLEYHTTTTVAASMVTMIWIGVGVGSPLVGWWSDAIGKRCFPLAVSSFLGVISLGIALYVDVPMYLMYILMFTMGLASAGQILTFAIVKEINTPQDVGTACGFNNMATLLGGALFQPLVGYLLRYSWAGTFEQGVPLYTDTAYEWALLILPCAYFGAFLLSLFAIKETHCQSQIS